MRKEGTEAAEENLQLAWKGLSSEQWVAVGKFNEEVTEQNWSQLEAAVDTFLVQHPEFGWQKDHPL